MKMNTAVLIGCGGIGCAIAPYLTMAFDQVVFVDGDEFEERNLPRQFGALIEYGIKAQVLAKHFAELTGRPMSSVPKNLVSHHDFVFYDMDVADLVVSGVDNNAARRLIKDCSLVSGVPCVLAGNEDKNGEAHLALAWEEEGIPRTYDPFDYFHFPKSDDPVYSCTMKTPEGEQSQSVHANFLAMGCAMCIINSLRTVQNPLNTLAHVSADTTFVRSETVKQIRKTQAQ